MKQAAKLILVLLMLAGTLPAGAQKTERTRSIFFTGGLGATTQVQLMNYGGSQAFFSTLFEAGYRHHKNSLSLQYLFQIRNFISLSFGEGGNGEPLNRSNTVAAVYARRVLDHPRLTIDLHGGAGVESYTDKD
jgi:hypothetical protein